jgi:hypothetical protein
VTYFTPTATQYRTAIRRPRYLSDHGAHVVTIDVLGGPNAIDDSVVTALRVALGR